MKISIFRVGGRDMDLFSIEELVADRNLLVWLFSRCKIVGVAGFVLASGSMNSSQTGAMIALN